ncbi:MAG TPA: hypothetical protein VIE39_05265 [Thermoanaerobaculia bacterium]|jgi:hypothetical protein
MIALLELSASLGLMLALFVSLAVAAHDDGRPRVAPARVRRK